MADLDLERAKKLLESAESLYGQEDYFGVAGLAYQAFESAIIALEKDKDKPLHEERKKKAKEKFRKFRDKIDLLWELRNVDFYGNVNIGEPKRMIEPSEVKESIIIVKNIVEDIERMLRR